MRLFRRAILDLARDHPFARGFVNSGRLSLPHAYVDSPLNTPDGDDFESDKFGPGVAPGAPAVDAPLADGSWLLDELHGGTTLLCFGEPKAEVRGLGAEVRVIGEGDGMVGERYDGRPGTVYLMRPDQHVAARFRAPDKAAIAAAMARAMGRSPS